MYMTYQELILFQSSGNFLFVYLHFFFLNISGNSRNNPEPIESLS